MKPLRILLLVMVLVGARWACSEGAQSITRAGPLPLWRGAYESPFQPALATQVAHMREELDLLHARLDALDARLETHLAALEARK